MNRAARPLWKNATRLAPLATLATLCFSAAAAGGQSANAPGAPASELRIPKVSTAAKLQAEHFYLEGAKALQSHDLRTAHQRFAKALALNPLSVDYATAEQIARANLVTQLLQESDKAHMMGHADEAAARLLEASNLDPGNSAVLQHQDSLSKYGASFSLAKPEDTGGLQLAAPVVLQPQTGLHSFHIHGTGQDILRQVLTAYGISPTIDSSVQVTRTNFDADDASYDQVSRLLQLATDSFFVVLDPKRVLVAKDNKDNRDRYQREMLETVYLPGLTPDEVKAVGDMARTVFDVTQENAQPNGVLTVRAPEARLKALNHTLVNLLDGRAQVDVEVRLIEIDTSHTTNIGVQLPQQFSAFNAQSELQSIINNNQSLVQEIVANGLAPAGDIEAIVAVLLASGQVTSPLLSGAFATFGGGLTLTGITIPAVTANLALNSSDTRMLEDVHLRLQDKDPGSVVVGEKYPIETSSYSGLTNSSLSIPGVSSAGLSSELAALGLSGASSIQAPIPQVQYQDIGLNLRITPHVLRSQDVTLDLELKLQALAGASLNNIPELTNRQFNATVTAHEGQTTAYVSDLTKQESKAVSGVPGLSELPGFQSTTDDNRQLSKSTLLILITPRVLRREHTELAGPAILLPRHD